MTPNESFSKTTLVLEAGENLDFLLAKMKQVFGGDPSPFASLLVTSLPGQKSKILAKLSFFSNQFEVVEINSFSQKPFSHIATPLLAYLPSNATYSPPPLEDLEDCRQDSLFIRPWIPPVTLKDTEWARLVYMAFGWVSSPALFQFLKMSHSPSLRDLERVRGEGGKALPYFSTQAGPSIARHEVPKEGLGNLSLNSRVLALVPHFNCEQWLGQCLDSLLGQTRPPDAVVVLDDASTEAPLEILRKYPAVTLLRSNENVGPYRLLQTVIGLTKFDAYMFQDSDDWSSLDRLEALLAEAERTGAEWIGTQELMYFEDTLHAIRYPLDVNKAPHASIRHPFCYPGSLISGEFLARLGGFASGLHFSGDYELLNRAVFAGKVANLDRYCYFRRIRKNSLVTSETTGLGSPARKEVDSEIEARKAENLARLSSGLKPLLEPIKTAGPVLFEHLAGPPLNRQAPF